MSDELLKTLENKVQNAVEMIELLKAEVTDLTNENNALKEARSEWEQKLTDLIGKFEELENADDSDEEANDPDSNDEDDSEENDSSDSDNTNDQSYSA